VSTNTTQAQINALLTGAKPIADRDFTDLHRLAQPGAHLGGIRKSYAPYQDEGETLPTETNYPQVVVEQLLPRVAGVLGRLFDLQYTQDTTNCQATADLVVDGQTLLSDVPATYLLFLEKRLVDLRTFITKLPTLDEAQRWTANGDGAGWWESDPAETVRTKKVPKTFVKWEPPAPGYTQPAQVDVFTEDERLGTYTTTKLSGAMPGLRVRELKVRIQKLIDATKVARERANTTLAVDRTAQPVFDYLFA
jgi:hypothetical protein